MKAFAAFVMRGPGQAASMVAAGLVVGIALPPFAWLSGAVLALVMLRGGAWASCQVMFPALLAGAIAGWFLAGSALVIPVMALAGWIPLLALAVTLRNTVRLDFTVLVAGALGVALVLMINLALPDPADTWRLWLEQMFPPDQLQRDLDLRADGVRDLFERIGPLMTGLLAASMVISSLTALFLARWWHAELDNPGGFGEEFRGLRLGQTAALAAIAIGGLALAVDWQVVRALAMVAGSVYLFQGLAVVHGLIARRGMSRAWLVAMYLLAIFVPLQMVLAWAVIGIVDAWVDFRGRGDDASSKPPDQDD